MTKTWETLFNLSSFMKYLICEVLPSEKVDSPSYILDSLNDLLLVTANCIDKIKYESEANQDNENNKPILTEKVSDWSEEVALLDQENTVNLVENKSIHTKSFPVSEDNEHIKTENNYIRDLPEKFIKLCNEMIKGRAVGHYCRPCDIVIFSQELWEKHLAYKIHSSLNDSDSVSCKQCNFVIFSDIHDSERLMHFHEQRHVESEVDAFEENEIVKLAEVKCDNLDKAIPKTDQDSFDPTSGLQVHTPISPVFIELDKAMHSGFEKGFYCNLCDESCYSSNEWSKHFLTTNVHLKQMDDSGCFDKCAYCQLVIFAPSSIQLIFNRYHMIGHLKLVKQEEARNRNLEDANSILEDTEDGKGLKSSEIISSRKVKTSRNIFIIEQFQTLNAFIHTSNVHGCYFCKLCNSSFYSNQEWTNHCLQDKHFQLLKKMKSWEGKCSYCSLTILGTRDVMTCYMEYHSVMHEQLPLSFEEKMIQKVSVNQEKHQINSSKSNFLDKKESDLPEPNFNILKKKKKRVKPITSYLTLVDEAISTVKTETYKTEDSFSGNGTPKVVIKEGNIENDSDYNGIIKGGAKGDGDSIFLQLLNSRIEQKNCTGLSKFGGLCLLCKLVFEDGFLWEDHLSDANSCCNISTKNCQGGIKELNIHLHGSRELLMKFKGLVRFYDFHIDS